MAKTQAELVTCALEKLKVVGIGQTASAGVFQKVNDRVNPVMSSLSRRGIFQWGDPDDLPDEAFETLADLLAHASAGRFGKTHGNREDRLGWELDLRNLDPYQLSYQPQTTEYF